MPLSPHISKYLSQIAKILKQLETIKPRPDNHRAPQVIQIIEKIEALARADKITMAQRKELALNPKFKALAKRTQTYYQAWEIAAEQSHASDELTKPGALECEQLERTLIFAAQEAAALAVKPNDRVAFIGSGYFPESAIAIAQHIDCRVTCVEQDALAVSMSEAVIRKWRLGGKITVAHCAAEEYDYKDFAAVFVAVMAHPKQHIIDRILKTNPHAKIACRSALYTKSLLYQATELEYADRYRKVRELFAKNPKTIIHSILIKP